MVERKRKPRRQRRVRGGSPQRINIRTTDETYARLVIGAAVAQLSIPRFLIESTLRESTDGWSLREQRWWVERLDVVETRLIRIGVNLNQMAAATNATGELPDELAGALRYFEATLTLHREVLGAINPADPSREPGDR
ncbi:MobC family plasmid mobilization relaxosome protein [Solihabitans fulvus]|uniref:MobC family plasmid mobilization relaxosome protein n=1 Tax=Solihabitans fulvus TaxID=1892852 RepID=A0A5B2XVT1_9PSEU|nr:plasmid mobilization relaxosome protein MobC [Solihabitans fulvus]KAA2267002.1 MobC family plasmid mobilization relaxosome protein [Solihabitans fulvus]